MLGTLRDLSAFDVFDLTGQGAGAKAAEPEIDTEALRASLSRKLMAILAEPENTVDGEREAQSGGFAAETHAS
jgi:hypothetical protein